MIRMKLSAGGVLFNLLENIYSANARQKQVAND